MKSGDPMDFPLWSKYIEKEIVQNDNFTELEKIIKIKSMLPNDFVLIFDYENPIYNSELLIANSIRKKINNLNILDEKSKAEDWNKALTIVEAINVLNKQEKNLQQKNYPKICYLKSRKMIIYLPICMKRFYKEIIGENQEIF
ncbi:hypothetical protein DERF_009779 [Dermatophagoides farinae]|uniref:Uncharacterized protein n=1 Tax=Dermatophagoides farinae TaxID=6954 RepID=A0A922HUL3_DERFA|nr:hypothetical protein DERF_009779 [Dermatophagoides farinae]